jgi:hypothetical protein
VRVTGGCKQSFREHAQRPSQLQADLNRIGFDELDATMYYCSSSKMDTTSLGRVLRGRDGLMAIKADVALQCRATVNLVQLFSMGPNLPTLDLASVYGAYRNHTNIRLLQWHDARWDAYALQCICEVTQAQTQDLYMKHYN